MTENPRHSKAVAIWLLIGVAMIMIQILLGGITRLTGSGLSITEWKLVTGALPPMNEAQWMEAFDKYRQTPQFRLLNFDFTLSDFKFIFFWEWFHRNWARLIGIVFAIPFFYFLIRRYFKPMMVQPLIILFLLGAIQGAIGWIMVASGLTGDAIYVKPAKLALHFVFALGLLSYTFWFALQLLVPAKERHYHAKPVKVLRWLLVLLTLQLVYGAFMAGNKGATAAPTWPDINGQFIPDNLCSPGEGWLNLVDNAVTLHFIHRGLGYLLLIGVLVLTVQLNKYRDGSWLHQIKRWPLILVSLQILLGILTVLSSTGIVPGVWGSFEWMAQLHQLVAMLLLLSLICLLYLISKKA